VYLTGDLRHHVVDEHLRLGGPMVVDAAHWALEFPWCAQAAELLAERAGVTATVCDLRTDPWTVSAGAGGSLGENEGGPHRPAAPRRPRRAGPASARAGARARRAA